MRNMFLAAGAALLSAFPAAAETAPKPAITITTPWARETPGGAPNGAAYLTITNSAETGDTLLSAETPAADRAELHEHIHEGDVMKMRRVDKLEIKPGSSLEMAPMGYHMMLIGLKAPLKAGDLVRLSLTFQMAGKVEVEAPVIALGAAAPTEAAPGHEHDHVH